jgi:N-acetylmuramoyl-L-alanine amidase
LASSFLAGLTNAVGSECSLKTAGTLIVALDVGHLPKSPDHECELFVPCPSGQPSARGVAEYEFNLKLATSIQKELVRTGIPSTHVLIPAPDSTLQMRVDRASRLRADFLISIHHDGVHDEFLKPWTFEGRRRWYFDQSSGFSLHVSTRNVKHNESLALARSIADQLMASGLHFSTAHEPGNPAGARAPYLDSSRGIYRRDELHVLRRAAMPAVLLEAGTIVNRNEEIEVSTPAYRSRVAAAVATAISKFCDLAADTTYRVTGVAGNNVLNIRSGPDSSRTISGTVPPDGRGVRIVGACVGQWCPIRYENVTGWVNRQFLAAE